MVRNCTLLCGLFSFLKKIDSFDVAKAPRFFWQFPGASGMNLGY
jgi:hypothetical protein